MIKYPQPERPDNFADAVKEAVDKVRAQIDNATTPVKFPDKWKTFKKHFFEAQHDKCGYCESSVRAVTNGDVEHYHPKAEVQILTADGRELDHLSNVKDRKGNRISVGYWWKAYEWENYLLSCGNCNSKWKRNFFPVEEDGDDRSTFPTEAANTDHPLVLHPFGRSSPENHLRFHRDRSVTGLSKKGRQTIRICGLDRPSLRGARTERTERTAELIDALEVAFANDDDVAVTDNLRSLHRLGAARHCYVGVTRSLAKHEAQLKWADIEEHVLVDLVERLDMASAARRPVVIQDLKARHLDFDQPDLLDDALQDAVGADAAELIAELSSQ